VALVALGGCQAAPQAEPPPTPSGPRGAITVLAASSLAEAFSTLGRQFEAAHPGSKVTLGFGPSSGLATQIGQGAPADVFAAASTTTMRQVLDASAATTATTFARNILEIAVPKDNPAKVSTLADLARPGVRVALCAPQVPCGAAATTVLANAQLTVRPVTVEEDVKATLTKVRLGEVDAGIVYVTDVRAAAGTVTGIAIPAAVNAPTAYPIAALTASRNPALAGAFVDAVLSPAGQRVLAAAGFAPP
jgi:molybdate transport system substrate-binding protein